MKRSIAMPIVRVLENSCFLMAWFGLLLCGNAHATPVHNLDVQIAAIHGTNALSFDALALTNANGQRLSVTRLDFLLSDFAVRRSRDSWLEITNRQAFISLRDQRSSFGLGQLPQGSYDRIRFTVGLEPEVNHGNPAQYPANHPLSPNLNNLHWTWSDGYIFFALEGHWIHENGTQRGYSYHLGNDSMLMPIEIPVDLILENDSALNLLIDLQSVLDFRIADETSSTHAREGDALAIGLRENVKRAFTQAPSASREMEGTHGSPILAETTPFVNGSGERYMTNRVDIASTGTPYRFTFPAHFPVPALPRDNPLTKEGVALGSLLFSEKLLSRNNSQSCASCHTPAKAFTDSPARYSIGVDGVEGSLNSMPLFNLAWKKAFFWDGRAPTLREQVLEPIQNPIEMHESLENAISKLQRTRDQQRDVAVREEVSEGTEEEPPIDYPSLFEKAFGTPEITADRLAKALEQFLLSQLSLDSKFDRALNNSAELTEEEKRGFQLFMTEYDPRREQFGADCFHCHGGPFFTSHGFANNGLDAEFKKAGRFNVTQKESDTGKWSVPSLRNVEFTAPYMHDGRFKTLEEVVDHYSTGVKRSSTLDPNLAKHPEGGVPLTDADKKALVAFLKTLSDSQYSTNPKQLPSE